MQKGNLRFIKSPGLQLHVFLKLITCIRKIFEFDLNCSHSSVSSLLKEFAENKRLVSLVTADHKSLFHTKSN